MTNDERAFREVDQQLAEDRQMDFLRRFAPIAIGGGAALVIAVAGWQIVESRRNAAAERDAAAFRAAVEAVGEGPASGLEALGAVAETASGGYRALADLRRAALLSETGEREGALALYRSVYNEAAAPRRLRDLARVRASLLALSDGRDAVIAELGEVALDETPLGAHAREIAAVAALAAGDYQTAETMFDRAAIDLNAPTTVRQRAEELAALAAVAKAGVDISRKVSIDDLVGALGRAQDAAADAAGDGGEDADAAGEPAPADAAPQADAPADDGASAQDNPGADDNAEPEQPNDR